MFVSGVSFGMRFLVTNITVLVIIVDNNRNTMPFKKDIVVILMGDPKARQTPIQIL